MKVVTENGWFAARPSGTENVYKIYAESFHDEKHLQAIVAEAQQIVSAALFQNAVVPVAFSACRDSPDLLGLSL